MSPGCRFFGRSELLRSVQGSVYDSVNSGTCLTKSARVKRDFDWYFSRRQTLVRERNSTVPRGFRLRKSESRGQNVFFTLWSPSQLQESRKALVQTCPSESGPKTDK